MASDDNNPFVILSNLFVENQRKFNIKTSDLSTRLTALVNKLNKLNKQIENNVFTAELTSLLNIQEESNLILSVAKEVEFQRDQIVNSVDVLTKSNKIKLNK